MDLSQIRLYVRFYGIPEGTYAIPFLPRGYDLISRSHKDKGSTLDTYS